MTTGPRTVTEAAVKEVIADSLGISANRVTDDLEYAIVLEWDSLAHIRLMIALEESFGVSIPDDFLLQLTSFRAIRGFLMRHEVG